VSFFSTFLGVGFSDLGAGGQLPFLSLVTQFVSCFLAGSAAYEVTWNPTNDQITKFSAIKNFFMELSFLKWW
jgi:hypothetical protein